MMSRVLSFKSVFYLDIIGGSLRVARNSAHGCLLQFPRIQDQNQSLHRQDAETFHSLLRVTLGSFHQYIFRFLLLPLLTPSPGSHQIVLIPLSSQKYVIKRIEYVIFVVGFFSLSVIPGNSLMTFHILKVCTFLSPSSIPALEFVTHLCWFHFQLLKIKLL